LKVDDSKRDSVAPKPDVAEPRGTDKGSFTKLPPQDAEKPKKERKQRVSTEKRGVPRSHEDPRNNYWDFLNFFLY